MRRVIIVTVISLVASVAQAGVIAWTDWTSSDLTSATGTVGGVGIDFTGSLQFAQLDFGVMVGTGAFSTVDYWTEGDPAPYTGSAVVDNRPPGFELLAFSEPSSNRLVFDSPVMDPVMAIVSQGRPSFTVDYAFDQPFTLLSEGLGFWGDGTFSIAGNTLSGRELHGVIQFDGLVSSISWESSDEFWHGFTIGLPGESVPVPGTLLLLGGGLFSLFGSTAFRRRR